MAILSFLLVNEKTGKNLFCCNIYRPQTKFAKVMFLHVSVILSTGGACVVAPGGACVVAWWGMCGCSGGAWLLLGGACVVPWGACMVAPGVVCMVA